MKKVLLILAAIFATNVYAAVPLPNGSGYIMPHEPFGPMNTGNSLPALVSLDSLLPQGYYNVVCQISSDQVEPDAHMFVRFDIIGLEKNNGSQGNLMIDQKINYSHQYELKDKNVDHEVKFEFVRTSGPGTFLSITRLDGWQIPFDYKCGVEFVVGKKISNYLLFFLSNNVLVVSTLFSSIDDLLLIPVSYVHLVGPLREALYASST